VAGGRGVVGIDTSRACSLLFQPDSLWQLENEAAAYCRRPPKGGQRNFKEASKDLTPWVDFVRGSRGALKMFRVVDPPEGAEPYNFTNCTRDTLLYHQSVQNDVQAVSTLNSLVGHSSEDTMDRATAFMLQFVSNAVKDLLLGKRVVEAIRLAQLRRPADIGEKAPEKPPEKTSDEKRREAKELERRQRDVDDTDTEDDEACKSAKRARRMERLFDQMKKPVEKRLPKHSAPRKNAPAQAVLTGSRDRDEGGSGRKRRAIEPECKVDVDQEFSDEWGCFVPKAKFTERPDRLGELLEMFEKAHEIVRPPQNPDAGLNFGDANVYPSYSPEADWLGMNYPGGHMLVNIAKQQTLMEILGTMIHEWAHETSRDHDHIFADAMSKGWERVMSRFV
jgi:hypothetical protein